MLLEEIQKNPSIWNYQGNEKRPVGWFFMVIESGKMFPPVVTFSNDENYNKDVYPEYLKYIQETVLRSTSRDKFIQFT